MEFKHVSVLLNECIEALNIKENGIYVDGTAGGGGHSFEIAKRLGQGKLYALDRDPDAVIAASKRLEGLSAKVINSNFENMKIYTILWGPQFKSQGLPEPKSQRYPLGPSCKNQETRRAHGFCLGEAASCSKAEGEVRVMPTREEKKGKKK